MTYSLFQVIGNGSVRELLLTLDPTKNYRFKMNASNLDGTSPWSNTVEWGAVRMDAGVYQIPAGMGLAKYPEDAGTHVSGVWIAQMHTAGTVNLTIRRYPTDWDGQTTSTPTQELILSTANLQSAGIATPDISATLTIFQVTTPAPLYIPYMVVKYKDASGVLEHFLLTPGATPTIRHLVFSNPGTGYQDSLIMEDGVLIYLHDISEALAWFAVPPTNPSNLATLAYDGADEILLSVPTSAPPLIPYLQNRYPLALGTSYAPLFWVWPYKLTTRVAPSPWQIGQIGWTPTEHTIVLDTITNPNWDPTLVQARYGASVTATYLQCLGTGLPEETGIVVATSTPDAPDSPPTFVMTDTFGWGGIFTIDEDLYVWGRSNSLVEEAPGTLHVSPIGVVNIHRMRLDQSSGLNGYSDVGPNLLSIGVNDRPESLESTPVTQVLGIGQTVPGNFNGQVEVLSDKSILIHSMYVPPTTLGVNVVNYLPPVFTTHPESVSFVTSGNPTFTAKAVATGEGNTLSYSWTLNGVPVAGGTVVLGVATLTLTVGESDNGSILRCVATDSFGYAGTSLRAVITVTGI